MYDYIEVVFKGERKEIYANPQQFPFKVGDFVIVEADKGEDLGEVNQVGALLSMKKSQKNGRIWDLWQKTLLQFIFKRI